MGREGFILGCLGTRQSSVEKSFLGVSMGASPQPNPQACRWLFRASHSSLVGLVLARWDLLSEALSLLLLLPPSTVIKSSMIDFLAHDHIGGDRVWQRRLAEAKWKEGLEMSSQ